MPNRFGFITADDDVQAARSLRFPGGGRDASGVPLEGAGPAAPPIAGASGTGQFVRSIRPPWMEKIGPISRDFLVADYGMALAAVAGATITSAALQFKIPDTQVGWLQECSFYILSPTASASVLYTILINGGPVQGFTKVPIFPGAANFEVIDKANLAVRLPMGCTVSMIIENVNANAWTVGGRLAGWYHPASEELKYWGESL